MDRRNEGSEGDILAGKRRGPNAAVERCRLGTERDGGRTPACARLRGRPDMYLERVRSKLILWDWIIGSQLRQYGVKRGRVGESGDG